MPDDASILLVEDDPELADIARRHLESAGFVVEHAREGPEGLDRALSGEHALLLLDLMLPGLDGLELCRRVRARDRALPVIVMTAKGEESDRVLGLELGADDYLAKPVSHRELVARVRALLRRARVADEEPGEVRDAPRVLRRGRVRIDPAKRAVTVGGRGVRLTAKEFDLLVHLARHPGRVYSRTDLLEGVWGCAYSGYEHTVNSHINRLRCKLNGDGPRQRYIRMVWGVGYCFEEHEGDDGAAS